MHNSVLKYLQNGCIYCVNGIPQNETSLYGENTVYDPLIIIGSEYWIFVFIFPHKYTWI